MREHRRVLCTTLGLMLGLLACDDPTPEPSDAEQYELDINLSRPLGSRSHHVLVGSSFDLEVSGVVGAEDIELECVEATGSGVVTQAEDGTFLVEGAGAGAVELSDPALACPDADVADSYGPDRWSVIGTEPGDVVGRWARWTDAAFIRYPVSPGGRGAFPEVLGRPLDELRVVADSPFSARPALVLAGDEEQEVRWKEPYSELLVPAGFEELMPMSAEHPDGRLFQLRGSMSAGQSFDPSATVLGTSFALPPVVAVSVEDVSSLELVPIYWSDFDDDEVEDLRQWGSPVAVMAITRDAQGRRIIDAPVEFELSRGTLAMLAEGDTLFVDDVCRDQPSGPRARAATITASLGQLEAVAELSWIAVPEQEAHLLEETYCVDSCSCSSASTPADTAPAVLALFGLGLWLRRRPRRPAARSTDSAERAAGRWLENTRNHGPSGTVRGITDFERVTERPARQNRESRG